MRIPLSYDQFQLLLARLFNLSIPQDAYLRVERAIKKRYANVEAIRVYLPELKKNVNQTVESGEIPKLLIKRTKRQKTGMPEIEIVFVGSMRDRHVEDLKYYEKHPETWTTWGELVLTPKQTELFIRALEEVIGITHF